MKISVSIFIFLSFWNLAANAQLAKDSFAIKYSQTITAEDLSNYLHVLASDSLEGRNTGAEGQKKAAKYLASKFQEFGAAPGATKDGKQSYFQEFTLIKKEWGDVYLVVNGKKKIFLEDFYAYGDLSFPKEQKAEVVFAGFGIESENYSDYELAGCDKAKGKNKKCKLDVKGKIVIIFNGEPTVNGKSLVTGDSSASSWANDWKRKTSLAKEKGAKAVFMVVGKTDNDFNARLKQLKHHIGQSTLGFTYKQKAGSAFFIPISMASEILGTSPDLLMRHHHALYTLKHDIAAKKDLSASAKPLNLKPSKIAFKCLMKETKISTENVLGYIEGTDKKDEVIVLTAHYDHLGKEGNQIFYGADDDGSGTVALLEIAQAFAKAKQEGHGPRRSILIMPVTAEEKGLMGSEYYADFPVYPLKNTVANLNIDMIGRLDSAHATNPDYVYLIGTNRLSTELHEVSEQANATYTNIQLDYTFNSFNDPNRFYFRSDHYNFAKNNIPVIFYFNGVHEDYHKATDTVDKIIFPKVEKITKLIFFTTWELANMEKRIEVNVISK